MGILDIFRWREARDAKSDFITFKGVDWPTPTYAGTEVTQTTAATIPAVYRCWNLNSNVVSTLPVDFGTKRAGKRTSVAPPFWYELPNSFQDWGQYISQVELSCESDGNAFILKSSTQQGKLSGLYPLNPEAVEPFLTVDDRVAYEVKKRDGSVEVFPSTAIIHIRGLTPAGSLRGLSPVKCAKQAMGVALAAEQFGAQFFGTGATMTGVITVPKPLDPAIADKLKEDFQRKHGGVSKSHAIGVLSGGAQWIPLSVKPEEAQFLETRRFTDVQIAHLYDVPPEYVTDVEGAKGFVTGLFARQYMWLQTGINPRLVRIERAHSALLPPGTYMKFNRNAFLAMDPTERAQFYAAGLQGQWLVPNEVRDKEDMDPLPGGDAPLWSVQWQRDE